MRVFCKISVMSSSTDSFLLLIFLSGVEGKSVVEVSVTYVLSLLSGFMLLCANKTKSKLNYGARRKVSKILPNNFLLQPSDKCSRVYKVQYFSGNADIFPTYSSTRT